ncbi:AAA family ATPase [Falsiroseomonas oryzae]|uniref:AAA family ATPase n=1 Tax=Falsiroseomonas oryzae TaxID=2766473 RepID=UPI0022EA7974|nr:AAA family ATPase [Roseomonas sp. MO-31]
MWHNQQESSVDNGALDANCDAENSAPSTTQRTAPELCPVRATAHVMVRRALHANPTLRTLSRAGSTVIVIRAPDERWAQAVVDAWSAEWRSVACEASIDEPDAAMPADALMIRGTTTLPGGRDREDLVRRIASALAEGRQVHALACAPDRELLPELLQLANATAAIEWPDGADLAEALGLHYGRAPSWTPTNANSVNILPADLLLTHRPDRDPDAHLRRAMVFVSRRHQAAVGQLRLEDLHGMQAVVEWGLRLRTDLALYRSGRLPWRDVDKGALIVGPPGTGKTTFGRALAASCSVPLIQGSVAKWQASGTGHLGDMLKAMRRTFDEARAAAPCILFVDEIDSLGDRSRFDSRNRDYSTQVLNSMLELLDGLEARDGVVFVGATNRPEALDPALIRAGRLDRMIRIDLPSAEELQKIFRHHLGQELPDADLQMIVRSRVGMTGADVERAVRGMRQRARHEARAPCMNDLLSELSDAKVILSEDMRWRIAVHEAGHAVAILHLRPEALRSVSVGRTAGDTGVLGVVATAPDLCGSGPGTPITRHAILNAIAERLAGRAAEWQLQGEVSAGAGGSPSSDIAMATWLATVAVSAFGLDGSGSHAPVWRGLPDVDDVPRLLLQHPGIARQVEAMLHEGYERALCLMRDEASSVEQVAKRLMVADCLTADEVRETVSAARQA